MAVCREKAFRQNYYISILSVKDSFFNLINLKKNAMFLSTLLTFQRSRSAVRSNDAPYNKRTLADVLDEVLM